MVTHLTPCDRAVVATGPLPAMGRGTRHLVNNVKFLLLVLTPSGTCSFSERGHVNKSREWTLRGWVSQQCIVNATFVVLLATI